MQATSHRRRIIVFVLMALAVLGGVLRLAAPEPSLLRDVGTLLLVLWLPVVGNVVGFVLRKLPRKPPAPLFAPDHPFNPHLEVELTPLAQPGAARVLPAAGAICTVVLGSQGFTARMAPSAATTQDREPRVTGLEFARPELALPVLQEGTAFVLAHGTEAVARGRVRGILRPG